VSLRARLLLGVLSLAAAGLLVADIVTYALLNSFLTTRVDQQLMEAVDPVGHLLSQNSSAPPSGRPPGRGPEPFPPGTYAALLDGQGKVVSQISFGFTSSEQAAQPRLSNPPPLPAGRAPVLLTAPSSGTSYRTVVSRAEPGINGQYVLVAVPESGLQSTLDRLLLLEAAVGVAVLLVLAGLGAWAVRLGLQPLDNMAETAGEIAAGDLQRRVDPATSRTEVGRLGLALNAMLAKIEDAFAARQASEDRLRRFVADASHELRTPVASIRGYAELFRRGAADNPDDLAMTMRRIEDESARMGHLVDDLLLLARLDEGRPLEQGPVDLSLLVADAAADARAIDPGHPVEVRAAEPVIVRGDEHRLRQVVANLVRNGLVHTPPGTAIEVAACVEGSQGLLVVADHGPGVPVEIADRVFERFYRADPSRGRIHGSSGLGLSIVAAVVASHGGTVHLDQTPGGGATFTVRLPLFVASSSPTAVGEAR
jgi:two-component system, OmpR family, sensor kinase